jgi:hypothetical protein
MAGPPKTGFFIVVFELPTGNLLLWFTSATPPLITLPPKVYNINSDLPNRV